MVYAGLQVERAFSIVSQPEAIATQANQVRASIDDDHTEVIVTERVPGSDIVAQTRRKRAGVNPDPYSLANPWENQQFDQVVKRTDPVLAAPVQLLTYGEIHSLAGLSNSATYLADSLETADEVEKVEEEQRPAASPRRSRGRRGMGHGWWQGNGRDGAWEWKAWGWAWAWKSLVAGWTWGWEWA